MGGVSVWGCHLKKEEKKKPGVRNEKNINKNESLVNSPFCSIKLPTAATVDTHWNEAQE